jgi:hypothetical protein
MKKVVFAGCSFTSGVGWQKDDTKIECKTAPELWVNLCHTNIDQLANLQLVNIGKSGASNTEIFESVVDVISNCNTDIKFIFCQWTAMPRYNFSAGLELWDTNVPMQKSLLYRPLVKLSNGDSWSSEYLEDLTNRFLVLHHLHGEIVKVINYLNILQRLANLFNIKIFFINGLCPWDHEYFKKLEGPNILPDKFTDFTKKEILDIDSKDDKDIFKLYNKIHNDYEQLGGINESSWINLYNSMKRTALDTNNDNLHPGIKSNQLYFQQVKNFLETQ